METQIFHHAKIQCSKNALKETHNPTRFWQPARTYCLNMATSGGGKKSLKFATFAKKLHKNPLHESRWIFVVTNW
jgi:hypothetical protein